MRRKRRRLSPTAIIRRWINWCWNICSAGDSGGEFMYIPSYFRVNDAAKMAAFIRRHSFATFITEDGGAPFASHLPMLFRPETGSHGTLVSHMARANPQWQHFVSGR